MSAGRGCLAPLGRGAGARPAPAARWRSLVWAPLALLAACSNNPYPGADAELKIRYSALPGPPKTLDPAVSYSALEHTITANVWEFASGPHNSINHVPMADEGGRPANGRFRYGPREMCR